MNYQELKDAFYAKVNAQLDIPFVSESTEEKLIKQMLSGIIDHVPVDLLPLLIASVDGLTADELKEHEGKLVSFINSKVDIPYLSEGLEQHIIRQILAVVSASLHKLTGDPA